VARTVLIGLDGATFTVLDPLIEQGAMPFLASLVRDGVRAELASTIHPLTPPAWTTLMTGRTPGGHGIFDFIRTGERGDDIYFTLNNSRDLRCETIWADLSRRGRSVTVLNFPLTAPPEPVRGQVVPGLVSWKHLRRNVYPPELYARLQALPGFDPKETAWDFNLEKMTMRVVPPAEQERWVLIHTRRERQWAEIARHLMATSPADLTAVLFDGPDKLQHVCWRYLDPRYAASCTSELERRIRERCVDYFRELDSAMADLVRLAGPAARVFVASDHGFGPTEQVFRVNTWLHQRGYLTWRDTSAVNPEDRDRLERRMDNDVALVDLARTQAYARTSATNGITIRVAGEGTAGGVPPAEYLAFRERLTRELLDVRDPASGTPIVQRVVPREEAYPGEFMDQAPDLTLQLHDGGFVSIVNKEPFLDARPEVAGTHHPDGVFLAHGPGVRSGARLAPLSIVDVPSALYHSLDEPVPEDFEGRTPVEVFEDSFLSTHPVRRGEATRTALAHASASARPEANAEDAEDEALLLQRLKALGYIE
jgi:predicted AlkP superfamily phosphohydrolase/phosphomutase